MSQTALIVLIVAIVAIAAAAFFYYQRMRSGQLRGRFGPEYDRAVLEFKDQGKAESELERRLKRAKQFHIRELPLDEREKYATEWRQAQSRFVDQPREAILEAHRLVNKVMRAKGYPVSDEFERNAEDLSADHPVVVQRYRTACTIAGRQDRGEASTEDLRNAMTSYRDLFEELLGVHVSPTQEVRR